MGLFDGSITTIVLRMVIILVILAILAFSAYIGRSKFLEWLKENSIFKNSSELAFFEVLMPRGIEIEISVAEQMFSGLTGVGKKLSGIKKYTETQPFVSFEVVAFKEQIRFYVVCPQKLSATVDRLINGSYPMAEINKVKEYNMFLDNASVSYASLKLSKEDRVPIRTYDDMSVDSLATLLDVFSKVHYDEAAAFQMVITPAGSDWRNASKDYIKSVRESSTDPDKKTIEVNDDTLGLIDQKAGKSGFHADIRLVAVSEIAASADAHLSNMLSAFDQFNKEAGNRFKKDDSKNLKNIAKDYIYRVPRESVILNTQELATLFHFPNKNIDTPHIQWLLSRKAPAADFVESSYQKDFMYLGKNTFRGKSKEIFMRPEDRMRHLYVIGQTGSGKSKFMGGMMARDIKLGHGCAFIDPHGSDAELILQQIPPERVEDVVIFDPADIERPVGLNMLEFNSEAQKTLAINEMLNIFNALYDLQKTGGPMFEQYFRYGIMLLVADPESGSTLLEVPKIFTDDAYREYKLSKCQDQEVIDFWRKQAEKAGGEASLKNIAPYIVSKLASFLTNAYVRPIVAQQESTINFRQIMDDGKILIAKLSKGKIGEFNASLLGMILVGKLLISALERESVDESQRRPFYLYIDEFQNFLTDGISIILSEARKYQLSLTIGHQFIGQLSKYGGDNKIRDSIFGNVGNKAIFRVGVDDAEFLKKEFTGYFDEQDLLKVENGTFFTKMLVGGKPTPPFTARAWYGESAYDLMGKPNAELAQIIKHISRLKYGKDKNLIENEVKMRGTFLKEKEAEQPGMGGFGNFKF